APGRGSFSYTANTRTPLPTGRSPDRSTPPTSSTPGGARAPAARVCAVPPSTDPASTWDRSRAPIDPPATLWQQHLDRAVARLNDLPGNPQRQRRRAARTTRDRNYDDSQRQYQTRGRRPSGPSTPGR